MKKNRSASFGWKLLMTFGKIAVFILLFPYQVVVNRKEGRYSVRTLAIRLVATRKVDGDGKKSHDLTFSMPGCSLKEICKKFSARCNTVCRTRCHGKAPKQEAENGAQESER